MNAQKEMLILENFLGKDVAADFFEKIWETKVCYIPTNQNLLLSDFSLDLFIEFILSTRHVQQSFKVFNQGNRVDEKNYIHGKQYEDSGVVFIDLDASKIISQMESGSTIIYQHIDRYFAKLRTLVSSLKEVFSQHVTINAYFTPPHSQGFLPHWDTHDVFILQVDGEKEWFFGQEPARFLPRSRETSPAFRPDDMNWHTQTLAPNNILYLPRGFVHYARTSTNSSLHLTIAMKNLVWTDFMHEQLEKAAKVQPELRQAIRPNELLSESDAKQNFLRLSNIINSL